MQQSKIYEEHSYKHICALRTNNKTSECLAFLTNGNMTPATVCIDIHFWHGNPTITQTTCYKIANSCTAQPKEEANTKYYFCVCEG